MTTSSTETIVSDMTDTCAKSQGRAVAEIAMTLTDKPIPTATDILLALNRAYEAGYAAGVIGGQNHLSKAFEMVFIPASEVRR